MKEDRVLTDKEKKCLNIYMNHHVSMLKDYPHIVDDWKVGQKIFMERRVNKNE